MDYQIRFVDFIDHDYRRKYRVIERIGDIEFAGGMVGDQRKRTRFPKSLRTRTTVNTVSNQTMGESD